MWRWIFAVTRKLFSDCSTCCETWGVKCDTWCITKLTQAAPKDEFLLWLLWFEFSYFHSGSTDILQSYLQRSTGWISAGWSFILLNSKNKKSCLTKDHTINWPQTPHRQMSSSCCRRSTFTSFTPPPGKKNKKQKPNRTKADTSDHVSRRNAQAACEWDDA